MTDLNCPQPVHDWIARAVEADASDLHCVVGHSPALRVHGILETLDTGVLDDQSLRQLLQPLCPPASWERFLTELNLDFSLELCLGDVSQRLRVNYFVNAGNIGACFRIIPTTIPDFAWAGFPRDVANRLAHLRNGLVLMSGVTGSGKTTTLAMIINLLNREGGYRILTVEEPVEYVFQHENDSLITQREVGKDVGSFSDGLKYGLRQDPDVILVGEVRDHNTAQMALSAAETGHLVFSTLHTRDAKGAISRFADLFPQNSQDGVRSQLAMGIRSVISQHLLPSAIPGDKRQLALEILFINSAIASAIRTNKLESIDNSILTGRSDGMITRNESVRRLLADGKITRAIAEKYVNDVSILR